MKNAPVTKLPSVSAEIFLVIGSFDLSPVRGELLEASGVQRIAVKAKVLLVTVYGSLNSWLHALRPICFGQIGCARVVSSAVDELNSESLVQHDK